ncbi:MAG: FG-GAP-like repeat-containing protein, partial [Chitinispirillaceae bacterium]|nr:FG-GAP-like repeat-containing protein [Chitinispirillaceae bacterium]
MSVFSKFISVKRYLLSRSGFRLVLVFLSVFLLAPNIQAAKQLRWGKYTTNYGAGNRDWFWVKNFPSDSFGPAGSNQFYFAWKFDSAKAYNSKSRGGELYRFKSSNITPYYRPDTSADSSLMPSSAVSDMTPLGGQLFWYNPTDTLPSTLTSGVPTYSVVESSDVRIVLKLNERSLYRIGGGTAAAASMTTQWTIYPTGQIFRWDSLSSLTAPGKVYSGVFQRNTASPTVTPSRPRMRSSFWKTGTGGFHDNVMALLGFRYGGAQTASTYPWTGVAATDTIADGSLASTRTGQWFHNTPNPTGTPWSSAPLSMAFYYDFQRNDISTTGSTDQLYRDSVSNGVQGISISGIAGGAALGMTTGSLLSGGSATPGDFNADGFNESEGAYRISASSNTVRFTLPARNDTCRFYPVFRISNYTANERPQYFICYRTYDGPGPDTIQLVEGTDYNIFHNKLGNELIVQVDSVFCDSTMFFLSSAYRKRWTGGGADNNWSTTANWLGGAIPLSTDTVIFDGTGGGNALKPCLLDVNAAVAGIEFTSGYTGVFTFGTDTLSVTGDAEFSSGGAIHPGTGYLKFCGTADQYLTPRPGDTDTLPKLVVANASASSMITVWYNKLRTGKIIVLNGQLWMDTAFVTDTVVVGATGELHCGMSSNGEQDTVTTIIGTGLLDLSECSLYVLGDLNLSTFSSVYGSAHYLVFAGPNNHAFTTQAGMDLQNIVQDGTGTTTVSGPALDIYNLALTSGTFYLGAGRVDSIYGMFSPGGTGTLDFGSSTVRTSKPAFSLDEVPNITGSGTIEFNAPGAQTFEPKAGVVNPRIIVNNPSGVSIKARKCRTPKIVVAQGALNCDTVIVADTVSLASGTALDLGNGGDIDSIGLFMGANAGLNFGSAILRCYGAAADFSSLSTLTAGTGTLDFCGGTQTFTPKIGVMHPHIVKNSTGTLWLSTNSLRALSMSLAAGTLDLGSVTIDTVGRFSITNGTATSLVGITGKTIKVGGNCILSGSAGDSLNLNPASPWTLTVGDTLKANYAVIGKCTASGKAGTASNSRNAGSNTKWNFWTAISTSFTAAERSSVDWGDYDNDGNLDVIIAGSNNANIYHNNANGTFTDISAGITGVHDGSVDWGDYDNDGYIDILLTGWDIGNSGTSKVYHNNGNGTFTDISSGLTSVGNSSAAWGDYDNDGYADILLTGYNNSTTYTSKIYHNNGNGTFSDISASLANVDLSSVAWGDYNNDGYIDILLTGRNYGTAIYRNNGNGTFTEISTAITGISANSVAWEDYDNDGNFDILLSGSDISKVYHNNGNGTFTDISAGLVGVHNAAVAWGDNDNDGYPDFLLTGSDGSAAHSKMYHNNGAGSFVDASAMFPGVFLGSVKWADYDKDGDLDFLLSGSGSLGSVSTLYRNDNPLTTNTAPSSPSMVSAIPSADSVSLKWHKSTDAQTASAGLTYNLRVGTSKDSAQIVSPMANLSTGFRRVSQLGNTNHDTAWSVKNLSPGKYYWSVQAIDNNFAGSAFASVDSFVITSPPLKRWTGNGADNNWSTAANWLGGAVPLSTDTVIFDGAGGGNALKNCLLDMSPAIATLVFTSGYTGNFNFGSAGISVTGSADLSSGGTITAATLQFTGSGTQQLLTNGNMLAKVTIASSGTVQFMDNVKMSDSLRLVSGTLDLGSGHVDSVKVLYAAGGNLDFVTSTLQVGGTVNLTNIGTISSNTGSLLEMRPSANADLYSKPGQVLPDMTIHSIANYPVINAYGNWRAGNLLMSSESGTTCRISFWGSDTIANVNVTDSMGAALTIAQTQKLFVTGNADFSKMASNFNPDGMTVFIGSGTQVFSPQPGDTSLRMDTIVHSGSGTLRLSTNNLFCAKFVNSAGVIDLNGRNIFTKRDFLIKNGDSTTFYGNCLDNRKITVGGNDTLSGQPGNLLNLTAAAPCTLAVTGALAANYAKIANSKATGSSGIASNSVNGGNNAGWTIIAPTRTKADNATMLSSGGSWIGSVAPTASDIAVWNDTVTAKRAPAIGGDIGWLGLVFANPAASDTIMHTVSKTLTMGPYGIDMSAASSSNLTMDCQMALDADQPWNIASGRALTISRNLSGPHQITKSGSGTLTMAAATVYTYTGGLKLDGGTVNLNSATSLGIGGTLVINAPSTIDNTSGTGFSLSNNPQIWNAD